MTIKAPIRLAIVGGGRGASFIKALDMLQERVELVAVCDHDESMLKAGGNVFPIYVSSISMTCC